jgi:hypothetical protein
MNKEALAWHIGISLLIGGAISYFTAAKWLAAAFWVSAAMYINGSIAYVEDAKPGGFDNPDGTETPEYAKGKGATKFALTSLAVTVVLASIGFLIQEYL